ncbi:metallophosphoesterase [Desulfuromonas acetoxidans]|uniref:Metallophosphoesterase n=1 Tax=Desulfuromonas acetoxidans (strain DSM 684 / 11070) TaxID=281689 RepID=Q1JWA3_DESA6|nr:metallophosphoesterase [Desulfuromonas acetoxidans]EAT14518.1 metallophosphoesterase [Desulfuromonas acetoxidans DSM 684]MBF0645265.1 metallophosphoesterase [Desulfuromonas acetoxidans]NVD25571.1 metallophosphoesterase [Desulfuromonas acetoxidans]NVE17619.1 metallophosphoesterase [Desulfuromonas acetoxidans]
MIFSLIFLTVCTLMQLYISWRIHTTLHLWQNNHQHWLWWSSGALWGLFALCWLLHSQVFILHHWSEWFWSQWLGMLFLLFMPLLLVDLATLFGLVLRRVQRLMLTAALLVSLVLCVIATIQGTRAPVITRYDVTVTTLPEHLDGLTLVAASDLHLGPILDTHWLEQRLQQVRGLSPDIVVLVGDIFETNGDEAGEFIDRFKTLQVPLGVWGVSGNHEYYGRNKLPLFEKAGIQRLQNNWQQIVPGLIIAGVDDLTVAHRRGQLDNFVESALNGRPHGATILLSHTPWQINQAVANNADIIISGHTHNGQIWPFNYLVERQYPYIQGHYPLGSSHLFVGRGTGTWGPRMRLWQPAEILHIVLHAAKNETVADTESTPR